MPGRDRPIYEAARLGQWLLVDIGRELRLARRAAGMRQADAARQLATSKSSVSRVENGRLASLTVARLTRHAAVVGLKPYVKLFPLGRRLLDKPQLELLARFRQRLHSSWSWQTEVPVPIAGDLRSGDCLIAIPTCSILVEAFTRLSDWQAQSAAAARKKRDLSADRLILLLAATHANRRALAEAGLVADGSFPLRTREALAALSEGRPLSADAIVFL